MGCGVSKDITRTVKEKRVTKAQQANENRAVAIKTVPLGIHDESIRSHDDNANNFTTSTSRTDVAKIDGQERLDAESSRDEQTAQAENSQAHDEVNENRVKRDDVLMNIVIPSQIQDSVTITRDVPEPKSLDLALALSDEEDRLSTHAEYEQGPTSDSSGGATETSQLIGQALSNSEENALATSLVKEELDSCDENEATQPDVAQDAQTLLTVHGHQPGSIAISTLGINLSYIRDWISDIGEYNLANKSTTTVCQEFIMPQTQASQQSLCMQLSPSPHVKEAEWFISHSWSYPFLQVIESLQTFFESENIPKDNRVIWFDMFSVSQHDTSQRAHTWWTNNFKTAIGSIGKVVMVMLPWDEPVTLTRAWCVFELLLVKLTQSGFFIAMTVLEQERLLDSLSQGVESCHWMLQRVNTRSCDAAKEFDKKMILQSVQDLVVGGFSALDQLVMDIYQKWLRSRLKTWSQTEPLPESRYKVCMAYGNVAVDQQDYEEAEKAFTEAQTCCETYSSLWIDARAKLGQLYTKQNRMEEAQAILEVTVENSHKALGRRHRSSVCASIALGYHSKQAGNDEAALRIFSEVLDSRRSELGDSHALTLEAMTLVAKAQDNKSPSEALALFSKVTEIRGTLMGMYHPETIMSMVDEASTYLKMGMNDMARSTLKNIQRTCHEAYGIIRDDGMTLRTEAECVVRMIGYLPEYLATYNHVLETLTRGQSTFPSPVPESIENKYVFQAVSKRAGPPVWTARGKPNHQSQYIIRRYAEQTWQGLVWARAAIREVKYLRALQGHKNIWQLEYMDVDDPLNLKYLYLVQQHMDSDLAQIIQTSPLTNDHYKYFMYQIFSGLKWMHSAGIVHRELKPGNILINADCDIVLSDFTKARGISAGLEENEKMTEYVTNRYYRAPEVLFSHLEYAGSLDIWAAGCVFGELLNRRVLFQGRDYIHQLQSIFSILGTPSDSSLSDICTPRVLQFLGSWPNYEKQNFSTVFPTAEPEALALLDQCLKINLKERPTAAEALKNPYFSELYNEEDHPEFQGKVDFSFEFAATIADIKALIVADVNAYKSSKEREEREAEAE